MPPVSPVRETRSHDEAVAKIKTALTTHPCLRQLDPNKPIVLLTDASTTGIGGGIFQEYDGKLCAVSYSSHRLTAAEQKYPITEL